MEAKKYNTNPAPSGYLAGTKEYYKYSLAGTGT
jgi:hypothetical protein